MRVYVIAAYPAVRAGLVALARQQSDWRVVGEGTPASIAGLLPAAALEPGEIPTQAPALLEGTPDVLLADLDGVPNAASIDAWLLVLQPRGGLVLLGPAGLDTRRGPAGQEAAQLLASAARSAEEQGLAFGALRRDATTEEIAAAVGAVGRGLVTLDRRLARELWAAPEQTAVAERMLGADEMLTPREREVLQLMAQGLPNKLIAHRLHITEHTAKFHVSAILTKLGAASRTEAVTLAAHRGLLVL
jgi:two-component system, NarL family, nitrate/nitrite response regulator NarL